MSPNLRFADAFKKFLSKLPEEGILLELNPGRGLYSKEFSLMGVDLIAAEIEDVAYPLPNEYAKQTFFKPLLEMVLPFRSLVGIWAHESFVSYDDALLCRSLSHLIDWLEPGGVLSLSFLEGEGTKELYTHSPMNVQRKRIIYRTPDELAMIFDQIGFEIVDAWREESSYDKRMIQIIAQA